jgi:hypothetical protein
MVSMLVVTMIIMILLVFVWLFILRRSRRLMRQQCDGDDAPHGDRHLHRHARPVEASV